MITYNNDADLGFYWQSVKSSYYEILKIARDHASKHQGFRFESIFEITEVCKNIEFCDEDIAILKAVKMAINDFHGDLSLIGQRERDPYWKRKPRIRRVVRIRKSASNILDKE